MSSLIIEKLTTTVTLDLGFCLLHLFWKEFLVTVLLWALAKWKGLLWIFTDFYLGALKSVKIAITDSCKTNQ